MKTMDELVDFFNNNNELKKYVANELFYDVKIGNVVKQDVIVCDKIVAFLFMNIHEDKNFNLKLLERQLFDRLYNGFVFTKQQEQEKNDNIARREERKRQKEEYEEQIKNARLI